MDPLLFGHSSEERVVSVAQLNDQTIRMYSREVEGVSYRDVPFYPFFFLTDPDYLTGFPTSYWLKPLAGTNPFRHLAAFSRWSEMWNAVHHVLRAYNATEQPRASTFHDLPVLSLRGDPIRQYLLQSGVTLFKNCPFRDVIRLQVEMIIRPRALMKQGEPHIVAAAARTSDGKEFLLTAPDVSEAEILSSFFSWIADTDPDVIEGHHLRDRILPTMIERSEHHGIPPILGRHGRASRIHGTGSPLSTSEMERTAIDCFGRHLVDTVHLIEGLPLSRAALERVSLGTLQRMTGIEGIDEPPSPEDLWSAWETSPDAGAKGLLRRLRSVGSVTERLLPSALEQTAMCPMSLDALVASTPSTRAETILLRAYIREKHSLPRNAAPGTTPAPQPFEAFRSGLYHRIVALDLRSFCGVHLAEESISPSGDPLRAFSKVAMALDAQREALEVSQQAILTLTAGLLAHLGNTRGLFGDQAKFSTCLERISNDIRGISKLCDVHNALPIHGEPEIMFVSVPDNIVGESNEAAFVGRMFASHRRLPPVAGRFKAMLAHRRRSFALLTEQNDVHIIGTSLVPRTGERFIRTFLRRCVECMLTNDIPRLHHTYASFHTMVTKHQWTVWDFCRVEIVHEETDVYLRGVEAGTRTSSPAFEAAKRSGTYLLPGTRVAFFVSGGTGDVRLTTACRLADEWDPNLPNENTAYYLQRLQDACGRLKEFFHPQDFDRIFALDDLFGFSDAGIEIVRQAFDLEEIQGSASAEKEDGFGIWLADEDPTEGPE